MQGNDGVAGAVPLDVLLAPQTRAEAVEGARRLLEAKEKQGVPEIVLRVVDYCVEKRIGFVLSRNKDHACAGGCKDAANKRTRLGHPGIPLCDELKSIVGSATDANGRPRIVAMHCRGDMLIDYERISQACGLRSPVEELPPEELQKICGMEFGTVNPFLLNQRPDLEILSVYDTGVLEPVARIPATMMTNAGNHTWGIEFDPREVIAATDPKVIVSFASPDPSSRDYERRRTLNPRPIGIITGNGPDSGIALWRGINRHFVRILGEDEFLGDISLPPVYVASVPAMGLSMELDRRERATWKALSEAVEQLKDQGVELLALACHTTHHFTRRIRDIFEGDGRKFISMPEVVIEYVREKDIRDLAILGIGFVAELGQWSAYHELKGLHIESLGPGIVRRFHDLGYGVKRMEDPRKHFKEFIGLLNEGIKSKHVVIALTELSILLQSQAKKERTSQKDVIDALDLYAAAIARASIGTGSVD